MTRRALMISAHPPGRGSGTGLRALVSLSALRSCFDAVDVVALASDGEAALADSASHLIPRRTSPGVVARISALRYGGAYYAAERQVELPSRVQELVVRGVLHPRYDLVWACQSLSARAALSVQAGARVLDIDNVAGGEARRWALEPGISPAKRIYRRLGAVAVAREERKRCNQVDLVSLPSTLEAQRLGSIGTNVRIVPNTVDAGPRARPEGAPPLLLLVGSLDYRPNIDAVGWLLDEILPRVRVEAPEARLRIVGRNPAPELIARARAGGAEVVANAPSVEPHYAEARVVLAPLRLGGGTRFKILEALARGLAVVTTSTGAEGLEVESGREILLADDPAGLAAHCVRLLREPAEAARLGDSGYAVWEQRYRSDFAQELILGMLRDLVPG